jgi:hypothetical protein
MTASPLDKWDDAEMSDIPQMFVHVLADLHDISERLARLEMLADEFAPAARHWQGKTLMRSLGRGWRG